jgi:Sulfatase
MEPRARVAGFGCASAFGGPCRTPTAERLAEDGLRFSRFHTTASCSPTRAALLSGRNHHTVGMGGITEIATSAPGYNSIRPPVSDDYTSAGSRFGGTVEWVQIDVADAAEDVDHLISPEERLRIAMVSQVRQ